MATIKTWKERINELDHSKGTSSVMIQSCMKAEIKALRIALTQQRNLVKRQGATIKKWRADASRYRKALLKAYEERKLGGGN